MSIEIDSYLKVIDAEKPCGDNLEYDPDFINLEQIIKGKPEQQVGDTVQEAEPPNWKDVRKEAEKLLERSHDLRVLVFYLRSLMALEGCGGFSQGLELIQKSTETFWQDIHPQLDPDDDNDPTERVNILMSLCDFETLLKPFQHVPLVESKAIGRFSLRDIRLAEDQESAKETDEDIPELSAINAAFQDCEAEQLKNTEQFLTGSLQSLNDLENFVTDQVGVGAAPNFIELRQLLKECHHVVLEWIEERGLDESEGDEVIGGGGEGAEGAAPVAKASSSAGAAAVNNNEDVRRVLKLVCDYYKKHEPSSPVPILLQRVIRLVGKDFLEIMKDMAPNGVEQVEFLSGSSEETKSD